MQEPTATHLSIPQSAIAQFCHRWQIAELALFGSVLREDFSPDSDIDVLFRKSGGQRHSWEELIAMKDELEAMFGRKVDLVPRSAIEDDPNYLRRREILRSARVIYGE